MILRKPVGPCIAVVLMRAEMMGAGTKVHMHMDFEAVQKLGGPWCGKKNDKPDATVVNEGGQVPEWLEDSSSGEGQKI